MDYLRTMLNCFRNLCSCLNCSEEISGPNYEPNERSHLLTDPINNSPALRMSNSDDLSNEYSQSLPKRDEQSALSLLVQSTAMNMIDVGALDTHHLEAHEINDRIKLYSERLQNQRSNTQMSQHKNCSLLKDVANPEQQLTADPISATDMALIKSALSKAQAGIDDIKVDHKEDIVVPFMIP